jgi:hypothetical protein
VCPVGLSAAVIVVAASLAFSSIARNATELVFVTPLAFVAEYTRLARVWRWLALDCLLERWVLKANKRISRKRVGPIEKGMSQKASGTRVNNPSNQGGQSSAAAAGTGNNATLMNGTRRRSGPGTRSRRTEDIHV